MKTSIFLLIITLLTFPALPVYAQKNTDALLSGDTNLTAFGVSLKNSSAENSADNFSNDFLLKNIQSFGDESGIAYTRDALYRTGDGGANWREIVLPKSIDEKISTVYFTSENDGSVILADLLTAQISIARTNDGGNLWRKNLISLKAGDLSEADLENSSVFSRGDQWSLIFRAPSSSNFDGKITFQSRDNAENWTFASRTLEIRRHDDSLPEKSSGRWTLKTAGQCADGKIGCVQETRIYDAAREITPPQILRLVEIEKDQADLRAKNSIFAAPNGSTRISLNRGFDKCTAATAAQMQTWWNNSPFYDSNIYISGRNRGCTQPQLTAAWVNSVSAMGWGLIPTIVGYQAPCSVSTTSAKHSNDPATAETQGRGEADIAVTDANNLGLTAGTVLYYDMERYDETTSTAGCRVAVNAFLKGWTERLHERGYISGTYGSPFNAQADWINLPETSRMDAVWLARWNNVMSVYGVAPLPDNFWTNHQRIHQWVGPRDETWGGVKFNIDNNISDAPVAGAKIPKNKPADFDGDGRTDVSVYRPDSGNWYILNSSTSVLSAASFGIATDKIVPGDYDGDGKTDTAVYRPSNGTWYFLLKAGTFNARSFGTDGDIPVAADYNGDGKTDVAVYRPSNGYWYISNSDSLGTYSFVSFGTGDDKPVPADYDGDGKTDIAVYRPSTGDWYVIRSSDGSYYAANLGTATDQPVAGDYDGDGKADIAVYRPSTGDWLLQQTTAGSAAVSFGTSGDLAVPGDYDGDNKTDFAVYRPSNGVWYLLQSQNGFSAVGWGNSTDKPVPQAYLPQ